MLFSAKASALPPSLDTALQQQPNALEKSSPRTYNPHSFNEPARRVFNGIHTREADEGSGKLCFPERRVAVTLSLRPNLLRKLPEEKSTRPQVPRIPALKHA